MSKTAMPGPLCVPTAGVELGFADIFDHIGVVVKLREPQGYNMPVFSIHFVPAIEFYYFHARIIASNQ